MAGSIETNPAESPNWRKHKNACPFYRERWFPGSDFTAGEPMYQVFCMKGTPPLTADEQDHCFHSKTCCWRLAARHNAAADASSAAQTAGKQNSARVS